MTFPQLIRQATTSQSLVRTEAAVGRIDTKQSDVIFQQSFSCMTICLDKQYSLSGMKCTKKRITQFKGVDSLSDSTGDSLGYFN